MSCSRRACDDNMKPRTDARRTDRLSAAAVAGCAPRLPTKPVARSAQQRDAERTKIVAQNEQAMRRLCDEGDLDAAATAALVAYGEELQSFISSRARDSVDAEEIFSMFIEDLWCGLSGFTWRCTMRTWAYTLARNAAARYVSRPGLRRARDLPLSAAGTLSHLVDSTRSDTSAFQKTEVKERFRQLRERMTPEDRMLLTLRIDRQMSYREIVIVLSGDLNLDDRALDRESVRLRQEMMRIRRELRRLGEAAGLLSGTNSHSHDDLR